MQVKAKIAARASVSILTGKLARMLAAMPCISHDWMLQSCRRLLRAEP